MRSKTVFIALSLVIVSCGIKVTLAGLGHNFDIESYRLVAELMNEHQSVYANTQRYNYGPAWMLIVPRLFNLTTMLGLTGPEAFHQVVAAFLAVIDVVIAGVIWGIYGRLAGLICLINPVSLLLTGFHSQFDNIAILFGLVGVASLLQGKTLQELPSKYLWLASACFALSLLVKHILFLFPVWLVLSSRTTVKEKMLLGGVPVGLFLLAFLPWLNDPASLQGIKNNVFRYSSLDGNALLPQTIRLVLTDAQVQFYFGWIPLFSAYKFFFVSVVLSVGGLFRDQPIEKLFVSYLLVLFVATSAIASQYIILGACVSAIAWKAKSTWFFWPIATFVVAGKPENIGGLADFSALNAALNIAGQRWHVDYATTQIPLAFLLGYWVYLHLRGVGNRSAAVASSN